MNLKAENIKQSWKIDVYKSKERLIKEISQYQKEVLNLTTSLIEQICVIDDAVLCEENWNSILKTIEAKTKIFLGK